jgi:hypothetical protein
MTTFESIQIEHIKVYVRVKETDKIMRGSIVRGVKQADMSRVIVRLDTGQYLFGDECSSIVLRPF